ncbi:response regulator transcription factor [Granulicella paludicola]|uniref:response regulator transcription factor n=1 Tax=Granulicella paludicola TaxID=474951 RepID=UPI0021DF60B3|nr:response regulator transcription factor [Granulicella paludicola]
MHVLVVEDDTALALFLQKGLKIEGHEVDCAGDGDAAIEYVQERCVDLMVLDLSLPRRDGLEVLKVVRERCPDTAVVVLTGRVELEHRVYCLNAGADDYLQKPFSFHELTARCRAILRRRSRFASPLLEFNGITMNLMERSVRYGDTAVDLTAKEFMVLEVLVRRRGECITRAEMLGEVWPGSSESGLNVVDVYITYLRRKFADAQRLQGEVVAVAQVIETVRGAGYRLRRAAAPAEVAYGS